MKVVQVVNAFGRIQGGLLLKPMMLPLYLVLLVLVMEKFTVMIADGESENDLCLYMSIYNVEICGNDAWPLDPPRSA